MEYKEIKTELLKQAQTTPLQSDTIEEWLKKGGQINDGLLWEIIKNLGERITKLEQICLNKLKGGKK